MPWLPILENVVEGDRCERAQAVDAKGRPKWVCHTAAHRVNSPNPGPCPCDESDVACFESLPCEHRGEARIVKVSLCATCSRDVLVADCRLFGKECTVYGIKLGTFGRDRRASIACAGCKKGENDVQAQN